MSSYRKCRNQGPFLILFIYFFYQIPFWEICNRSSDLGPLHLWQDCVVLVGLYVNVVGARVNVKARRYHAVDCSMAASDADLAHHHDP